MKKRIPLLILGVIVGATLLGTGLGQTVGHIVNTQAQEQRAPEVREYVDLSDKLLSEFIIIHNEYVPSAVENRAKVDPAFTILGMTKSEGAYFIHVQLIDGVMTFGYTPDALQPMCMVWRSTLQLYRQMPAEARFEALRKDVEEAFGKKPETVNAELGIIIFGLTDEIQTSVKLFPDGTVTVGTGFRKNYQLPSQKLDKDDA